MYQSYYQLPNSMYFPEFTQTNTDICQGAIIKLYIPFRGQNYIPKLIFSELLPTAPHTPTPS